MHSLSREKRLLEIIRRKSLMRGDFTLASGAKSNYYLDLRPTTLDPEGAVLIGDLLVSRLAAYPSVTAVGGLEFGAVPVVSAMSHRAWPSRVLAGFVVRKGEKDHGTGRKIEGGLLPKTIVAMVDDVTTKGGSVLKAVRAAREAGAVVACVMSIVDRQEGATESLRAEGLDLVSLFTTADVLG
jgi:orotate phosphoribosyltransferase